MTKIRYKRHARFVNQFQKLQRKYHTLDKDLTIAENAAIELLHIKNLDNRSIELIPGFNSERIKICKLKKFACQSLKGKGVKSGIRIIYAFYPKQLAVEYLEIYYKERSDTDMDYDFVREYFDFYSKDKK